ncbi:MAG TPA: DUF115 domain-containing protein, partial [Phycisphaerales bacterium]|nr:DUF115 domain-containing protein [Phycisphaerales bacterium]
PSLDRNIDVLARPGVRDRVVIIAAQTVLKRLLARGIVPHYVTALDHHEISRRFYEGLAEPDVSGVTLVVEPKVNPAVLSAFPGKFRCAGDRVLDELLGPGLARPMGSITAGATVAHLAYYLARHLGCDPVVLVGQDLGFTDGQYYHAGAAIHEVWAGELNEFNTLEMLEWQRLVRSRHILRQAVDQLGRPIYTDEQMLAYLVQFEREFAADASRGLSVIDATEGGVAKQFTTPMTLGEALAPALSGEPMRLPETPGAPIDGVLRRRLGERLATVRRDAWRVGEISRRTRSLLADMITAGADQKRVGALIDKVHALRDEVTGLQPAFGLVNYLNQTGGFKRFQADRAIELDATLTPADRQRRQIERDISNVTWIADASDQLGSMLDETTAMLGGGPRVTGIREMATEASMGSGSEAGAAGGGARCAAVIPAFACAEGLLSEPVAGGMTALEVTLRRLARCDAIDAVVMVHDRSGAAEAVVRSMGAAALSRLRVAWADHDPAWEEWWCRAWVARRWSETCWRGGPGNLTIWDELCRPESLRRVMEAHGLDAAVMVGPGWAAVDAPLTDAVIRRHRENPDQNPMTFSSAAPGIVP